MKISEFAVHFNVKKSTIRYYTEIKLLFPDLTGTYPEYNNLCIKDMSHIIELKNMGFSIDEIQQIKARERFLINNSEDGMKLLQTTFDHKIEAHQTEIESLTQKINKLKTYTSQITTKEVNQPIGIPFKALKYLQCPKCHSDFNIKDAQIIKQHLFSGKMTCPCGNSYQIIDGIIMSNNMPITPSERLIDESSRLENLNNELFALVKKCSQIVKPIIKKWDHSKGIIFSNSDIDIVLMELEDLFDENGLYFFCSYDYESLIDLKNTFEAKGIRENFIFIYYRENIPLSSDIPYFIDNIGNLYDLLNNETLGYGLEKFSHLPTQKSEWLCLHLGKSINASSQESESIRYFSKEEYIKLYQSAQMVLDHKESHFPIQGIDFLTKELSDLGTLTLTKMLFKHTDNIDEKS